MMRILHIEDDPLWAEVVGLVLKETAGVSYLGVADTAAAGLKLCTDLRPDLVLLDMFLPDSFGPETIAALDAVPALRLLLLTVRIDEATLYHLTNRRVVGMVWKNTFVRPRLSEALRRVECGGVYYSPEVQMAWDALRRDPNAFFKILSNRELELLPLLGAGASDQEIACAKRISPATVKSHREHVMKKLDLHRVERLMHWAVEKGFFGLARSRQSPGRDEAAEAAARPGQEKKLRL